MFNSLKIFDNLGKMSSIQQKFKELNSLSFLKMEKQLKK